MHEFEAVRLTCPYCKQVFFSHLEGILHFELCNRRPLLQKLSDRSREDLDAFARDLDAKVEAAKAQQ